MNPRATHAVLFAAAALCLPSHGPPDSHPSPEGRHPMADHPQHHKKHDDDKPQLGELTGVDKDAPGVDPSTGSPTMAPPGEAVQTVHAVPPGRVTIDAPEQEVHPIAAAPSVTADEHGQPAQGGQPASVAPASRTAPVGPNPVAPAKQGDAPKQGEGVKPKS